MSDGSNLSIRQTAEKLGVCVNTVYNQIGAGRLPAFKIGGRTVIPADAVKAFQKNLPKADIRTGRARASA